jgi:hypothetical protein
MRTAVREEQPVVAQGKRVGQPGTFKARGSKRDSSLRGLRSERRICPSADRVRNDGHASITRLCGLFDGVAVGVDFVDFADVELANTGFDFAHVAYYQPD